MSASGFEGHLETLRPPADYPVEQLEFACGILRALGRGKLVLVEPPRREPT